MKTCEQFAELLPALAEDCLGSAEAEEVRLHVAGCAECAESWKTQELISRHFRETDLADKPDYFWTKQRKHILNEVGLGTSRIEMAAAPRRLVPKWAVAAAAALLVAVGTIALLKKPEPGQADPRPVVDRPKDPVTPPIVKDETPKAPAVPEPAPNNEGVAQNDPPKEPEKQPEKDPVVKEDPKKQEPPKEKPKEELVQKPPAPKKPTTTGDKPKEEPAAPKPEEVAILPGHPRYPVRLAQEQIDILLPVDEAKVPVIKERDNNVQVAAVLKAARARLDDARGMLEKNAKADVTEQVDAYAILVGEGVGSVLYRSALERSFPSVKPELRAQLALLEAYSEDLRKGVFAPAIQACNAALQTKVRRHYAKSKDDSGALASARETVLLLINPAKPADIVVLRTRVGFATVGRNVTAMLEDARLGRLPQVEAYYEAYQKLVDGQVRMLEMLEDKESDRLCAMARVDLTTHWTRFRGFRGPEPVKGVADRAADWTADIIKRLSELESFFQGKGQRPPKREPGPGKEPDPPPPPKPEPPPFGEKPPPSPPPPAPEPPFGEQP
jgi:hypothetical protein